MENSLAKFESKTKGLFDQKGGTLGMVLLAIGVIALLVFFQPILAIVQAALTNILGIVALVLVISAVLYVMFDKKARLIIGTLYMMAVRSLMGMVIKIDPIAILEDTISKMYKRIDYIEEKMAKLNGVRLGFKDKIKKKKAELQDCLDRQQIATEKGKKEVAALESRQSVRLTSLVKDYMELQASAENWYTVLSRLAELAKLTAEDGKNEVAAQKERYEMVKTSHNAFKSMMSIIKGDPDDLAMFNQAFIYVNSEIEMKVGEMDRIINTTGGMLDKMDMEKEVFALKGADISKKYQELGIDALFAKMEELPSQQMNQLQTSNMTQPVSPLQKSASKYFN
jgi:hypothetical protein